MIPNLKQADANILPTKKGRKVEEDSGYSSADMQAFLQSLLRTTKDPDSVVASLAELGIPAAARDLLEIAETFPAPFVCVYALKKLAEFSLSELLFKKLVSILGTEENWQVRNEAASTLAAVGGLEAILWVAELEINDSARIALLLKLGEFNQRKARDYLRQVMNDNNNSTSVQVAAREAFDRADAG